MLSVRTFGATVAVALAASASATAATPSAMLAKTLKTSMQATYDQHKSGFVFTTVTCKIASTGRTARCQAHFTDKAARLLGVIQVSIEIASSGGVQYQPTSITCTDSKTGAKLQTC
jgi:hypothetical protein